MKLRKDPECPICGEHPTIREWIDYEQFCGIGAETEEPALESGFEISVQELNARILGNDAPFVLDVREPHESEICRIPNATLIPQNEVAQRRQELDPSAEIVVHCRSGVRSAKIVKLLRESGFQRVKNLKGGILAWADEVDSTMPKY